MDTPEDVIREAEAAEALAGLVSYARDKAWLLAQAAALRDRAARMQAAGAAADQQPPAWESRSA